MELESYKLQFKILKKHFPKLKQEDLQIDAVNKMILNGKAELIHFEQTDDCFDYPEGTGNYPGWNNKIDKDLFIEFEILLNDNDAKDHNLIRQKASNQIISSNIFDYIYDDEQGRHISFGRISFAGIDYEVPEPRQKNNNVEKTKKQLDLFKKKKG